MSSLELSPADKLARAHDQALFGLSRSPDSVLTQEDRAIVAAYCARARARMARGEYHLAAADYARARLLIPWGDGAFEDLMSEAEDGRSDSMIELKRQLEGGTPSGLPVGYLVAVECGGLVAVYPRSEEGRCAAIARADYLANNEDERSYVDNMYVADSDEFDTVVYDHDGNRSVEVYRAPPLSHSPPPAQ